MKFYEIPKILYQLLTKSLRSSKHVKLLKARFVDLQVASNNIHIDGESVNIAMQKTLNIRVHPRILKVITPFSK